MKTKIISDNGRYSFVLLNEKQNKTFASKSHHPLVPFVKSNYQYAWEAQRDARKLFSKNSHHIRYALEDLTEPVIVDISTEEMLENHYTKIYKSLRERISGSVGSEEKQKYNDELKIVIGEMESVIENLTEPKEKLKIRRLLDRFKKLRNKYFRVEEKQAIASKKDFSSKIDREVKEELTSEYAEKICNAIQEKHPGAVYDIDDSTLENIKIIDEDSDDKKTILKISINEDMMVNSIVSVGDLYKIYPSHSDRFYQRYWKPIVEKLGHFFVDDFSLLVCPSKTKLPDIPKESSNYKVEGWDVDEEKYNAIDISFKTSDNKSTWFFDRHLSEKYAAWEPTTVKEISNYTETDYLNAIVKCVDPSLESVYGRTGSVIQVMPHSDIIEIDVNFGRGLGVVRLTEDKIEIVS